MNLLVLLATVPAAALALVLGFRFVRGRARRIPDSGDLAATIDADLARMVKGRPEQAIAVGVYRQGRTLVRGLGPAGLGGDGAPDGASVFQIGSVTKVFTATLLQVLCDEGRLSLDDTLGDLVGASTPLAPRARGITLRQLATHTSGLPRLPKDFMRRLTAKVGKAQVMHDPYSHFGPDDVFGYLATAEGLRPPGRFAYSNLGMGLLAHVMERCTGQDLGTLMADRLLRPLGLDSTAVALTPGMRARLVPGHTAAGRATPCWTFNALAGAGALSADANDLLAFIRASVEGEGALGASLRATQQPQPGGTTALGWIRATPVERFFGVPDVLWHDGMVGGYAAYIAIDVAARAGVVVLSNRAYGVNMLGLHLLRLARTQSWAGDAAPPA